MPPDASGAPPDIDAMRQGHCVPLASGTPPLSAAQVAARLALLPGWSPDGTGIARTFQFRDYFETIAFVNAVAWIAQREDHHPDLQVGYRQCRVSYCTHSIGGVSDNDFICAAKVDALLAS